MSDEQPKDQQQPSHSDRFRRASFEAQRRGMTLKFFIDDCACYDAEGNRLILCTMDDMEVWLGITKPQ